MEDKVKMYDLNYSINVFFRNVNSRTVVYNYSNEELLSLINAFLIESLFNKEKILIITSKNFDIYKINILLNIKDRILDLNNIKSFIDISKNLEYRINNMKDTTGKTIISKVNLLIRDINKKVNILNNITNLFYNKGNDNLSLIDKYNITNKKITKQSSLYEYYKIFRIKKPLTSYSYNDISKACKNILTNNLSKDYIKYRRFIDNELFYNFKNPFNYELIANSIENINSLINKKENKISLKITKYTKDFIDLFNIQDFDEETLKDLANMVNLKYNYSLLKNKENTFLSRIFKKDNNSKLKIESQKFYSIEKDIYNEYLYNYKLIKEYINQIEFLNDILVKEAYKDLKDNIINGEDINDILVFYSKLLETIYKIKEIYEFFYNNDSIEEEILFYCYENLEVKSEIDKLVEVIPILKLNLEIEEEETKCLTLIDIYKDYDTIIKDIYNDIIKKDKFTKIAIKSLLDNTLRESSHIIKPNLYKENFDYNYVLNSIYTCIIQNIENFNLKYIKENFKNLDKVLILNDENYNIQDYLNINDILDITKNVLIFNKNGLEKVDFNNFYFLDILNMDIINPVVNDKLIKDILAFLKSIGYTLDKNLYIDKLENQILIRTNINKIIIKIDSNLDTNIFKDIYYTKTLESDFLFIYRIWTRDFWINREKEFLKLKEFIKSKE